MEIKKITVGRIKTNCYIVSLENGETFLVDPGDEAEKIIIELEKIPNLNLRYILLTHGHFDHVLAVDELKERFPKTDVIIHENDLSLLRALPEQGLFVGFVLKKSKSEVVTVTNGTYLPFGEENIEVIATPGHSRGGVCYLFDKTLFSGDTIFWHTYGRTDLPESNEADLKQSLTKLLRLPEETFVYPGHGRATFIGEEKRFWRYN